MNEIAEVSAGEVSQAQYKQNEAKHLNLVGKELGSKDFLILLSKQLSNQDPLNPIENTDFIAQMAHFTSLANSNEQLRTLTEMKNSLDVIKENLGERIFEKKHT